MENFLTTIASQPIKSINDTMIAIITQFVEYSFKIVILKYLNGIIQFVLLKKLNNNFQYTLCVIQQITILQRCIEIEIQTSENINWITASDCSKIALNLKWEMNSYYKFTNKQINNLSLYYIYWIFNRKAIKIIRLYLVDL